MTVNPVQVAKAFFEKVKAEFDEFDASSEPNDVEKQAANLLFQKFEELTLEYDLVDENVNLFGKL